MQIGKSIQSGSGGPVNSVPVTVTGTAKKGQTLSGHAGTWSGSPTLTYQWKREGVNIPGATSINYVPVEDDVLSTLTLAETATNGSGSSTVNSSATAPVSSGNTTSLGQQVHVVGFSDSIYNGALIADITIPSGILWLWNGTGLTEITSQSVCNGNTYGSPWKTYAVNYVANNPGKKVILIQSAVSGSKLIADWGVGSTNRNNLDASITACLSFLGLDEPIALHADAVINDVRVPSTIEDITVGLESAISYWNGRFPNVPIKWAIPGRDGSTEGNSLLLRKVRNLLLQKMRTVPNFYVSCSLTTFGALFVDNLHPVKSASEFLGVCNANWWQNSQYSKYARAILSCHAATLTQERKDLIAADIDALGDSIYGYEYLFYGEQSTESDSLLDYALLTMPSNVGSIFNVDDSITTSGTTTSYFQGGIIPSSHAIRASQNDIFISIYTKTVRSDNSTLRAAMGAASTGLQCVVGHTTTGVFYRIDDNTLTVYGTDAKMSDDSEYVGLRDSSTSKALRKNGVEVHRATVTSTGFVSQRMTVGCYNNGGSPTSPMNMDYRRVACGAPSLVNLGVAYTSAKARIDGWNF